MSPTVMVEVAVGYEQKEDSEVRQLLPKAGGSPYLAGFEKALRPHNTESGAIFSVKVMVVE
jgi:hypothetical protein